MGISSNITSRLIALASPRHRDQPIQKRIKSINKLLALAGRMPGPTGTAMLSLSDFMNAMQEQTEAMARRIERLEAFVDGQNESLTDDIRSNIVNHASAVAAVQFYNLEWFQDLLLSQSMIQRVASVLARQAEEYGVSPIPPLWVKLAGGNFDDLTPPPAKPDDSDDQDQ